MTFKASKSIQHTDDKNRSILIFLNLKTLQNLDFMENGYYKLFFYVLVKIFLQNVNSVNSNFGIDLDGSKHCVFPLPPKMATSTGGPKIQLQFLGWPEGARS